MMRNRDRRLDYFREELDFLKEGGRDFAKRYPKVAARLDMGHGTSRDPYTNMLFESFAFLAGQIRMDLDAERERLASLLLDAIYPHLTAPIPPMAIAQFVADPANPAPQPRQIDAGFALSSQTFSGSRCNFTTCYDVEVLPLEVAAADFDPGNLSQSQRIIVLLQRVDQRDVAVADRESLAISRLRFHLGGDSRTAGRLYECLNRQFQAGALSIDGDYEKRCEMVIEPVGFADEEAVLPFPTHEHQGFRLLQEYFCFPDKFRFIDVTFPRPIAIRDTLSLRFEVGARGGGFRLDARSFCLGCTPVVNLYEKISEPIVVDERKAEHAILADQFRNSAMTVHSVKSVHATEQEGPNKIRHLLKEPHNVEDYRDDLYWTAHRRGARSNQDVGSIRLALSDREGRATVLNGQTIYAKILCSDARLADGLAEDDPLFPESNIPGVLARLNGRPSAEHPPPTGQRLQLLASALSLNHLPLSSDDRGLPALKALLSFHCPDGDVIGRRQIDAIASMQSKPITTRLNRFGVPRFCYGVAVDLAINEEGFAGYTPYILASVLDRFLPIYAAVNTCTRLTVRWAETDNFVFKGDPRCGTEAIL